MIAVTGATGLIGSSVVRQLLNSGKSVRVLVRKGSNMSNVSGLDVEVFEGDLEDASSLAPFVSGCEGLFHLAANYKLWTKNPDELFRVNCDGSKMIILAAAEAGVQRIIYTSSVATLGVVEGGEGNEETPVSFSDMTGVYKQSKFRAEQLVMALFVDEKIPVVIVNPTTPVGPRDVRPTPTGRMILEASLGRIPAYVETGLNIVHVDDVAAGHLLAYENGILGEKYILGGDNIEFSEILTQIAEISGHSKPKIKLPHNLVLPVGYLIEFFSRVFDLHDPFITVDGINMAKKKMFFSSEKAKKQLGYKSRPSTEALKDAISWFAQNKKL